MTKSEAELAKEREQAQQQLEQLLSTSRPKGIVQGCTSGVSNIVSGAVGAAGIAVIAPTAGLATGLKHGGIVGGIVGVTGGAVVGALGAAALAVSGAVSGVGQIARGVIAVPQSIVAPRQGKWWNENEGKWILTNMQEEEKKLDGIPEDDDDILGKVQNEIDESFSKIDTDPMGDVKDMYYYDILELPASAEQSAIKRKYYLLARKYHPDKTDDPADAEKFKAIAEAYSVLSDPELRKKYDKDGREALSPDKTDEKPNMDPSLLFAYLFGSDLFYDYIGRFSIATSASVGDSSKISIADAKLLQKRRVTRMAIKLIAKIDPYVQEVKDGKTDHTELESVWLAEGYELSKASYGYQLVTTIGKLYNLLAVTYEGSMDSGQGMPSISKWAAKNKAGMDKRNAANKNQLNALKANMEMMKVQAELQQKLQDAKTDEERDEIKLQMQTSATAIMVRVLWTTAVVDISSALFETTQMIFFDTSVDKDIRKYRAQAVKKLGELWMDIAAPDNDDVKDEKQLYEDAAFAAMLETVKRKDEAAHGSQE